jgi:hypothetical protein
LLKQITPTPRAESQFNSVFSYGFRWRSVWIAIFQQENWNGSGSDIPQNPETVLSSLCLKETLLKLRAAPFGFHKRNPISKSVQSKGSRDSQLAIRPFHRLNPTPMARRSFDTMTLIENWASSISETHQIVASGRRKQSRKRRNQWYRCEAAIHVAR